MAKCEACMARQQTIMVLADWVDSLRNPRQNSQSVGNTESEFTPPNLTALPTFGKEERGWLNDDEEEIAARIESGDLAGFEAQEALSRIQALNTNVTIERR